MNITGRITATFFTVNISSLRSIESQKVTSYSSRTAHRAKETIDLLSRETPDFISPQLWLRIWPSNSNSPDLNPADYHVWSVLEELVYRTRIRDINHLRTHLVEE